LSFHDPYRPRFAIRTGGDAIRPRFGLAREQGESAAAPLLSEESVARFVVRHRQRRPPPRLPPTGRIWPVAPTRRSPNVT